MLLAQTIAIDTIFLIVIVAVKTTTDIKGIQIIMPLVVMDIIMVVIITTVIIIITDIMVTTIIMHLGATDMGLTIDMGMVIIMDVLLLGVAYYTDYCLDINLQNKKSLLFFRRDFLFCKI